MVKAYGSGSFVKQSFTGTLDLIDFPLDSMDGLPRTLDLQGRIDADLSIGGTLSSPIAGGKVEIQDFAYQDYTLGNLTVLWSVMRKTVRFSFLVSMDNVLLSKCQFRDKVSQPRAYYLSPSNPTSGYLNSRTSL